MFFFPFSHSSSNSDKGIWNKSLHIEDGKAPTTCILSKTCLILSVEFIPLSKTIVISSRGIPISSTRLNMLSIRSENKVESGTFAGYVIVWKGMFWFEVVKPTPIYEVLIITFIFRETFLWKVFSVFDVSVKVSRIKYQLCRPNAFFD